jgi:transcriptional regulator with XRE-family HTH domain
MMISLLRKEKGMTQLELAEKMGVTDKAVSKWERDLSFPDINSIPKLAQIFEISIDEVMQVKTETKENINKVVLNINTIDEKCVLSSILKVISECNGNIITINQEHPVDSSAYISIAIDVVELVDSVPVVAEDPVEPIQKSADTSLSSDEKSDAPVVTECKGLTHEEPHYINPVPSQPKEEDAK